MRSLLLVLALFVAPSFQGAVAGIAKIDALTTEEENSLLQKHNDFRCLHGSQQLTWDNAIAARAQTYADGCNFAHSAGAGPQYGENLYTTGAFFSDVTEGVELWYSEIGNWDFTTSSAVSNGIQLDGNGVAQTGHFHAVVWSGMQTMGCGICRDQAGITSGSNPGVLLVCQYEPFAGTIPDNVPPIQANTACGDPDANDLEATSVRSIGTRWTNGEIEQTATVNAAANGATVANIAVPGGETIDQAVFFFAVPPNINSLSNQVAPYRISNTGEVTTVQAVNDPLFRALRLFYGRSDGAVNVGFLGQWTFFAENGAGNAATPCPTATFTVQTNAAAASTIGAYPQATNPATILPEYLTYRMLYSGATNLAIHEYNLAEPYGDRSIRTTVTPLTPTPAAGGTTTVRITDPLGVASDCTLTIIANSPPTCGTQLAGATVASNAAGGTQVGTPYTPNDPNAGTTFSYTVTNEPRFQMDANGQISRTAVGVLTADTPVTLSIVVNDGQGGTVSCPSIIVITPQAAVNNAPTCGAALATQTIQNTVANPTNVATLAEATDADGDALTYSLATAPFTIDTNTRIITTNQNPPLTATAIAGTTFQVAVSDGIDTVNCPVTIIINQAPICPTGLNLQASEVSQAGFQVGSFAGTDNNNGDTISYAINPVSTQFAIDGQTGAITRGNTPVTAAASPITFDVVLTDTAGGSTTCPASIVIVANIPPTCPVEQTFTINDISTINANGQTIGTLTAGTDPEGEAITATVTNSIVYEINDNAGTLTVRNLINPIPASPAGGDSIQYNIQDATGATTTCTFIVIANTPPTCGANQNANIFTTIAAGGGVATFTGTDNNAGDTITYAITNPLYEIDGASGTVTRSTTGTLTAGNFNLDVSMTDAVGQTVNCVAAVAIVVATNTAPACPAGAFGPFTVQTTDGNAAVATFPEGTDAEGQAIAYTIPNPGSTGGVTMDGARQITTGAAPLTATPSAGTPFQVVLTDTAGGTTNCPVVLIVNAAPECGTAITGNQPFEAANGDQVGTYQATDGNTGDTLQYIIANGGDNFFTLNANTGVLTRNAVAGITAATRTIDVTVNDANGGTVTCNGAFVVTTLPANVAPVCPAAAQSFTVQNGVQSGTTVGIMAAATDANGGDTLTYAIIAGGTAPAQYNINNQREITSNTAPPLTVTPDAGQTVIVQVSDQGGLTDDCTVTLIVNGAPACGAQVVASHGPTAAAGTALGTYAATDPNQDDVITYAITGGDGSGFYSIDASTGVITRTNIGGITSIQRTLTITLTDTNGGTTICQSAAILTTTGTVGVTPPSPPPTTTVAPTAQTTQSSDDGNDAGLIGGLIAGIGGGVLLLIIIGVGAFIVWKYFGSSPKNDVQYGRQDPFYGAGIA